MISGIVSHYKIIGKIGSGGMGVVYKAEDTKLGRTVALKFLPPSFSTDEEAKARFIHEAKSASALDHPNICNIHEIDETDDGQLFISMAFYEGETLKDKIAKGPIGIDEAIKITLQICEGLEEAHKNEIIHRDIKPANIFVTNDGIVKILDFGLAKAKRQSQLTKMGSTLGTVDYMSPEQASGQVVDRRTDIWAIGVVLYEMLTGKRPFAAEYEQALVYRILNEEPESITNFQRKVPVELERIVERALAKSASKRYQDVGEMAAELQLIGKEVEAGIVKPRLIKLRMPRKKRPYVYGAIAILLAVILSVWLFLFTGTSTKINSIAVMPLVNLSGDPNQDYFAEGMTEELITNLAQISTLKVISHTSMMQYKGTRKPLPQIAKELNVNGIIEGSVLREGGKVRITAQLIDAATDQNLWAESYQRDLQSVLNLQGEIARAIAERVRATLTPTERTRLTNTHPVNPEAYEAYLKGKFYLNKMTQEGYEKALTYFNEAIEKDSTNPLPYAQLAIYYSVIGHERYPDAFDRAKAAAHKAEELGQPPAEMYLALGMTKLYHDWNYAGAGKDLQLAIELNPSLGEAHRDYSWYLSLVGQWDEALAEMKLAQEVEPLTPLFDADRGWQYWTIGQYDKAIEEAQKSLKLDPSFNQGLAVLGYAYAYKGMFAKAIAAHKKLATTDPDWKWSLAHTYAQAGQKEEARKILAEFLAEKPKPTGAWAGWFIAETYAALGEKDEAIRWLEAAYKERQSFMPWINVWPPFAPLHSDPRFQDLVRRMNLPE